MKESTERARYWSIRVDVGDGGAVVEAGGTAFTDEQVREQVALRLRDCADRVEATGRP